MRDERLRVGAAQDGVHHRRLDLDVAVRLHVAADQRHDLAALAEDVAHLGVHDEVEVALAVTDLAVGQAVELLGQRAHRLRQQAHRAGRERELAALRAHDGALRLDDVTKVELAEKSPAVLLHVVHAAEELELARDVLELDEDELSLLAQGANATGERVDVLGVLAVGKAGVALVDLGGVRGYLALDGIGVDARVDQRLALGATHLTLIVDVDFRCLGLVGHRSSFLWLGRSRGGCLFEKSRG